jgi:murein DD-endopeptidase MepM/ murein hydrolase activator NlpD
MCFNHCLARTVWGILCLLTFVDVNAQQLSNNEVGINFPLCFPLNLKDFIKVSSSYGDRAHPILKKKLKHEGIDLVVQMGKPVYATAQGVVAKSLYEKGYGNTVVIVHSGGLKTLYAHLWVRMVGNNEKVNKGQLIGLVGCSGNVTGPHLHYEIWLNNKKIDPMLVWKSQFALSKENY